MSDELMHFAFPKWIMVSDCCSLKICWVRASENGIGLFLISLNEHNYELAVNLALTDAYVYGLAFGLNALAVHSIK